MATMKGKILHRLNPELLKRTPKLSDDNGAYVDLDSSDSLEYGAKKLMMKFFRNQDLCDKHKKSSTYSETEITISSTKYNDSNEMCELISEKLTVPFVKNYEDAMPEKPGRKLQKLKMDLQQKMSMKWEKEYKKRVSENKISSELESNPKKLYSDYEDDEDGDDDNNDDNDDDDNDGVDDDDNDDVDDDADSVHNKSNKNINAPGGKNEKSSNKEFEEKTTSDSDNADDEFKEDENNDFDKVSLCSENKINENETDFEGCSLVPAYQPGGGLLFGGSELTQCEEGLPQNLLSPSLIFSMNDLSGSKIYSESVNYQSSKKREFDSYEEDNSFKVKSKLFSQNLTDSFDLSDAFELCSGKFPEVEEHSELQLGTEKLVEESQNGIEDEGDSSSSKFQSSPKKSNDDSEIKDLEVEKGTRIRKSIITFEDSEKEEENESMIDIQMDAAEQSENCSSVLKLLSDDLDEDELAEEIDKSKVKKTVRKSLHFSDEEDETNDNDNLGEESENEKEDDDAFEKKFFECDERSVHYDSEENEINPKEFFEKEAEFSGSEWSADEDEKGLDEFDIEEGDADNLDDNHVRSQLEKIHIRRLLDDDAREVRLIQEILFEDGDLHSNGKRRDRKFKWKNLGTFNEHENEVGSKEENGNSSEDESVEEKELRKIRHEKELFLMAKKKNGDLSSDEEIFEDFHPIKITRVKRSVRLSGNNENQNENLRALGIGHEIKKIMNLSNSRGSFLTRNEQFLSKLAKATSCVTDNVLGPKHSRNFVFATKSPEKTDPDRNMVCKRQVEEDSEDCRRMKKTKLLSLERDTGPSIFDFLI